MIIFLHKKQFCIRTLRKEENGIKYYKCIFCGYVSLKIKAGVNASLIDNNFFTKE